MSLQLVSEDDPILRAVAAELTPSDLLYEARGLAEEMAELMREHRGCGLAAPQVGVSLRLVVWDIGRGVHALANPVVFPVPCAVVEAAEGCLSLPDLIVPVKRPERCVVTGYDPLTGRPEVRIKATGWLARVLQHEIDHLDGTLMTDAR